MTRIFPWQSALIRALGGSLSPAGARASLLILIFHRVLAVPDPMNADEPDAARFALLMDLLQELFNVISLREAAERLARGSLPTRAACVTFDDGYENNCSIAAPILAERNMTATFFIATGFLGKGCMWNDSVIEAIRRCGAHIDLTAAGLGRYVLPDDAARARLAGELLVRLKYLPHAERLQKAQAVAAAAGGAGPTNLMMSESQVRRLAKLGMEVGAHSVSHPILAGLDDNAASREIAESKAQLEAITGNPVTSFAYPNGRPGRDYLGSHADMVRRAGFTTAVSTAWGCARAGSDVYQLPRVSPWDRTALRYGLRLVRTYLQPAAAVV